MDRAGDDRLTGGLGIAGHCCRCPTGTVAQLADLTGRLVADPYWRWRRPHVIELTGAVEAWGRCSGRVIAYRAGAPACVVPHELAHLAAGLRAGHDAVWAGHAIALYDRMARLLITASRADRPGSARPSSPASSSPAGCRCP